MAKARIAPCKITDDLYWVGVHASSPAHLLVSGGVLTLIDTGTTNTREELISNIESLGFDVRKIAHIIHSHAHYDHVGATNDIVKLSGAKTYGGVGDYEAFCGKNDLLWATKEAPENHKDFYFEPDVLIKDGDVLRFGNTDIRFLETPGHTAGVLSIFFNVHHKGKEYLAGMFGGAGFGSMKTAFLDSKGLPHSVREDYVRSVNRIIAEPVEVHIGNHPANNNQEDKSARMTEEYNPFVEEKTWVPFLTKQRDTVIKTYNIEI